MRTLIMDYTFDSTLKTITFPIEIPIERFLIITNITRNVIIYSFADPSTTGTVVGNTLLLACSTEGMDSSDKLQIFVEYDQVDFLQMNLNLIEQMNEVLSAIRKVPRSVEYDSTGRLRANIETGTLTTVTTLSNLTSSGGFQTTLGTIATSNISAQNLRRGVIIT